MNEELGILTDKKYLHLFKIYRCEPGKEFQGIHYLEWDGDINTLKLEKNEVDQVQWFETNELFEILISRKDNN